MGNSTAHDLVIEGIEKWEGSYWVFGHSVTVDVNVYEGHKFSGIWYPWISDQNYVDIDLITGPGRAHTSWYGTWSTSNSGGITMYTESSNGVARTDWDYRNTITHEFGHVMGVDDGYADTSGSTTRPTATMLAADDVMVNNHLKSAKVSSLDVQMMVMAASKNEWQYFMAYDGHKQSKGALTYGPCTQH